MTFTRTHAFALAAVLIVGYWAPGLLWPEKLKISINAVYFMLSLMTAFMLLADVVDIAVNSGRGLSWQAATAKVGLFVLMVGFACARMWGFVVGLQSDEMQVIMLASPVGGFFTYLQGVGLGMVFFGFNQAGELQPRVTVRGTALITLAVGIIIGLVLGGVKL